MPKSIEYFGQVYSFEGPLAVQVNIIGEERSFAAEISLSCRAFVPCSRCLKETPLEISGAFRYFYTPSVEEDGEAAEDEMTVLYPAAAEEVDLSGQIWESLVMSLPERVFCRDDCPGLCPTCGADLSLGPCACPKDIPDPRLQALKDVLPGVSED